jgi:hypothetical protein
VLVANLACADVLGVPGAPRLIEEQPPAAGLRPEAAVSGGSQQEQDTEPGAAPVPPTSAGAPPAESEGAVPQAGLGLAPGAIPVATAPSPDVAAPAPSGEPAEPEPCVEELAPLDVILLVDNSGSMDAETAAVERSLVGWSQRLGTLGLDYRLILLSRHRTLARSISEAASTSICVEQPLSGLERCPSGVPVLGERFFHYSIKLDASDSLERALEGFAEPDPARLAPGGWSQWLRAGAHKAFIEISDADSDLPATLFAARLGALAPEHFASSGSPGFVFYSVVGMAEKASADEAYLPEEPIESAECRSVETRPDNAGEQYQTLSILTGGLRFSLCGSDALGARLERIADDLRLVARRCSAPG